MSVSLYSSCPPQPSLHPPWKGFICQARALPEEITETITCYLPGRVFMSTAGGGEEEAADNVLRKCHKTSFSPFLFALSGL